MQLLMQDLADFYKFASVVQYMATTRKDTFKTKIQNIYIA